MAAASPMLRLLEHFGASPGRDLAALLPTVGAVYHQRGEEAFAPRISREESRDWEQNPFNFNVNKIQDLDGSEDGPPRCSDHQFLPFSKGFSKKTTRDSEKKKITTGRHGRTCATSTARHGAEKRRTRSLGVSAKDKLKVNGMQNINRKTVLAKRANPSSNMSSNWSLKTMTDLLGLKADCMAKLCRAKEPWEPLQEPETFTSKPTRVGSMAKAKELATSGAMDKLKEEFKKNFFAESSRRSRESKRREVLELAKLVCPDKPVIPLHREVVEGVAAAMKRAEMKSGFQYLVELKLLHVEAGFDLSAPLLRTFDLCKKSLERGKGPVKRAAEVKIVDLEDHLKKQRCQKKSWPEWPALSFLWGAVWMLREIELRKMKGHHVRLIEDQKQVSIWIPVSKCDQKGEGVRRTLACCGKSPCTVTCPWSLSKEILAKSKKIRSLGDTTLVKSCLGASVSKAGMIAAWKKCFGEDITGHSPRRSGAMHYVRAGLQIQELAFLGRWRSSVVLNYAEEALQETAVRIPSTPAPLTPAYIAPQTPSPHASSTPTPVPCTPAGQVEGVGDLCPSNVSNIFNTPKNLWVVTKGRGSRSRPAHMVTKASWNLSLKAWSTACGWNFAEKSSEFSFLVSLQKDQTICTKCKTLHRCATSQRGGEGASGHTDKFDVAQIQEADEEKTQAVANAANSTSRKRQRRVGGAATK